MADSGMTEPTEQQVIEAINWLVLFEAGNYTDEDKAAFLRWQQHPQHAFAWQRLGRASQYFQHKLTIDSQQALNSLNVAERVLRQKRRTLKALFTIGGLGFTVWATRDISGIQQFGQQAYGQLMADLSTTTGEQKKHQLADGSLLHLNTQSAINIDLHAKPELALHYGEAAIQNNSPLHLRSRQHLFMPTTGSDFTVSQFNDVCRLHVVDGHVRCFMAGQQHHITAGHAIEYRAGNTQAIPFNPDTINWRIGLLTAQRMQLGEFITELGRYRPGYLSCADDIADLVLSGSFPIKNTEAILDNLCQILPIRQHRVSRYWVRLVSV